MTIAPKNLTVKKAHDALLGGDVTASALTESYLAEIEKKNKALNAYLEVFDDAREQARAADVRLKKMASAKRAELPALFGIPLAVKDNILIKGRRAGAASKILDGYVAPYDAGVVTKLKEAGAVFLGRTNMDEFAMGSSTENSAYGVTKNPHDLSRVAGGSSGGSAAAVAADLALAALGSDTGGSIREPAGFCGIVGLKPTYGALSRRGLIAMGSSLDCIGPLAKSVEDAEALFEAMRGRDPADSTSLEQSTARNQPPKTELKIGVPRAFLEKGGIDEDVLRDFNAALARMERCGCAVADIALPELSLSLPIYYIIMPAEASTNLARYDGVKYGLRAEGANLLGDYLKTRAQGFGTEVRRRILLGTYVLSAGYYDAYYNRAVAARRSITALLSEKFKEVDAIATPTAPTAAWTIGEKGDPLSVYLADTFTVTANIAGIPAISLPSGFARRGGKSLPLGLQLMAARGREDILFEAAHRFEAAGAA